MVYSELSTMKFVCKLLSDSTKSVLNIKGTEDLASLSLQRNRRHQINSILISDRILFIRFPFKIAILIFILSILTIIERTNKTIFFLTIPIHIAPQPFSVYAKFTSEGSLQPWIIRSGHLEVDQMGVQVRYFTSSYHCRF